MSKRNVAYVKPEEPSFLRKLKQQIGYQEGPTVDTKREDYGDISEEDFQDIDQEKPTVVVLNPGDLTAEEAAREEEKLRKEEEETPADLNTRVLFKAPSKSIPAETSADHPQKRKSNSSEKKGKKLKTPTLLSFDEEEHDD